MHAEPSARVVITWALLEEARARDPLLGYRVDKYAAGRCSAPACDEAALLLITRPHARHGTWTRGLCTEHALRFRLS